MKRKGFTLIEIVSAIVIVGIIALITVPITIRLINNAKKKSFLITAEGIVKATSLSLADHEEEYESYFVNNDFITFKFSKSEGKEGESIDEINGKKIKLSFDGKSPIGGEINLYKNGDVEVINLTDGTFYVNKDIDTELTINQNTTVFTREELQAAIENLEKLNQDANKRIDQLENEIDVLQKNNQNLEEKNTAQDSDIKENTDNIKANTEKITNLTTTVNNINKNILAKTYPVGSIYISTSSTNPGTIFGGTWESFGTGRTLVGVNTSDTNFNTVSKTGGSQTHTHTGTVGSTTLTTSQIPSHTHGIPALSGSTNSAGSHSHATARTGFQFMIVKANALSGGFVRNSSGDVWKGYEPANDSTTGSAGSHSHTVTTTAATSNASGGGSSHTHSLTINSGSNLSPYITVYMWKRVS